MIRTVWVTALLRATLLAALLPACAIAGAAQLEKPWRFDVITKDGAKLVVQIIARGEQPPKAVVLVVPGSGGLEDPYFDADLARHDYDPSYRGGLTATLLKAGFGVAYFSERGYRDLQVCMKSNAEFTRANLFVQSCIDQDIRAGVDLDVITSDTRSVIDRVETQARLWGRPLLVLAYSEGMYHTARSNEIRPLDVAGIVSVGGPFESMADTARYQIEHKAFFAVARRAFTKCPGSSMNIPNVLACAGLPPSQAWIEGLRVAMGSESIGKKEIGTREAYWQDQYRKARSIFVDSPPVGALAASFEGVAIDRNWAVAYYSQFLQSSSRPLAMLTGFRGPVRYLFGSFDHLVRIPSVAEFSADATSNGVDADMKLVPSVNHGLADESGVPPREALDTIVSALTKVLKPASR